MGLWCSPSLPLKCVAHGGGRVVIWYGLKLSTRCADSVASGEVKGEPPPVIYLGPLGMSYRVIFRWMLLVLGLEVPMRGQAVKQGQLLQCWAT